MQKFLILILISLTVIDWALAQSAYTASERFNREGRYVKITLLMGNPVKIFVSGKEQARLDLSKFKMEFRPQKGGSWQELKINDYGEYYTAETPLDVSAPNTLEVKTTLKNTKSEIFRFKLP